MLFSLKTRFVQILANNMDVAAERDVKIWNILVIKFCIKIMYLLQLKIDLIIKLNNIIDSIPTFSILRHFSHLSILEKDTHIGVLVSVFHLTHRPRKHLKSFSRDQDIWSLYDDCLSVIANSFEIRSIVCWVEISFQLVELWVQTGPKIKILVKNFWNLEWRVFKRKLSELLFSKLNMRWQRGNDRWSCFETGSSS